MIAEYLENKLQKQKDSKTCDCFVNQTEVLVGKDKESEAELSINSLPFPCFSHQDVSQSLMC